MVPYVQMLQCIAHLYLPHIRQNVHSIGLLLGWALFLFVAIQTGNSASVIRMKNIVHDLCDLCCTVTVNIVPFLNQNLIDTFFLMRKCSIAN